MLELAEPLSVWLSARSLEAAREFYGTKLGLPLWHEEPAEALHFGAGGVVLTIRAASPADLPPRGAAVVLTVANDIDAFCEELRQRGVTLAAPLADRPFGRSAMFRDPDGHELWVCRPSDGQAQFDRWRREQRLHDRRVPVQRRPQVRRHERTVPSRRRLHPDE